MRQVKLPGDARCDSYRSRVAKLAPPDRTERVSVADARKLGGMLGVIVPAMLAAHGCYACTIDDERVLFVVE